LAPCRLIPARRPEFLLFYALAIGRGCSIYAALDQKGPNRPGDLVGQRDSGDLIWPPSRQRDDPRGQLYASARLFQDRCRQSTKLEGYKDYLLERVVQARPRWIPATALLREIGELGYTGGISQLKAWLAPLKKGEPEAMVRFEAPPGKQMQADFTWVRRGRDPLVALVVATLGYSRATYVKFSQKEDVAALARGCAKRWCRATSAACPSRFCLIMPKPFSSSAMPTETGSIAGATGFSNWSRNVASRPAQCRPYRAQTKG